jgi:large subunit ribosomal protein L15
MNLNSLTPAEGSVKGRKRIARGQGSGYGGTSTRGHKGAKSRSGYSKKVGFEGGQMPLQRRVPKFGFKNINRVEFKAINLDVIQFLADKLNVSDITIDVLIDNGVVSKNENVKILGRGELKSKVNITAHKFSATAKAEVESKGGVCSEI